MASANHCYRTALAWLLATSALCSPALAQSPTGTDNPVQMTLPTVTVEGESALGQVSGYVARQSVAGTKTDTPIIETPQSISVLPRDVIDQRQAQTMGEALRYSAGVRPGQYGNDARGDWIQIRGFEATDTSQFLNGLRFNPGYVAGSIETYGLERYEIVRGPGSVLYGQMSPGGLINMVQRRPTDTAQGEVRLTAGSNDWKQLAFTSSGPLSEDRTWTYSMTGLGRLADLDVDSSRNDRLYLAPALTWRPDADTRVTLLPYYQRDRTIGGQFLPFVGTVTETTFGRISRKLNTGEPVFDKYDRTQYGIGWEFERRLNETFTVSQNARYSHVATNWKQVYGGGLLDGSENLLNRIAYDEDYSFNTFQVDTRGEARFATGALQHTLLTGFDYQHISYKSVAAFATATPLDVYAPTYGSAIPSLDTPYQNRVQGTNQYGLYAQDQIRLGDRWVAMLGIRQDWVEQNTKNRPSDFAGGENYTSEGKNDDATTWRVGLTYLAPNGLAPYVSYSTSFLPQAGAQSPARGNAPFEPTRGEQYEVGLKYQPPGLNSFVQVSAFQIKQRNSLTTDPENTLYQIQTGEIRVRGAEAEMLASLAQGLNLIGSITYLDAEITRDEGGNAGNRPAGVSKLSGGLYADYTFGEASGWAKGLGLGAGLRFVGNTAADNANSAIVPSVTLLDASLRYDLSNLGPQFRGLEAAVNASNITDERYVARCTTTTACFYGNGRLVLGSLSYRW